MKTIFNCLFIFTLTTTMAYSQSSIAATHPPATRAQTVRALLQSRTKNSQAPRNAGSPVKSNYRFDTIDFPGVPSTIAFDASATKVVGTFDDNLNNDESTGFTLKANLYKEFTVSGAGVAVLYGLNDLGQMVGSVQDLSNNTHGLVVTGGIPSTFDPPSSIYTYANKINDTGAIVGGYEDGVNYVTHGFKYASGIFTTIDYPGSTYTEADSINKQGDIVGFWEDSVSEHGYLLHAGTFTSLDYPQALYTEAYGINNNGAIVGFYYDTNDVAHGFFYKDGSYSTIDVPRALNTYLIGILNNGTLVGTYQDVNYEYHGFTAQ